MLKLSPAAESFWLDLLPGLRVRFRLITVVSMLVARQAAGKLFKDEDQEDIDTRVGVALTRELARRGIMEWEGVGDAEGQPIPVSLAAVDALLSHWPAFDAIDRKYVAPALGVDAEKNA